MRKILKLSNGLTPVHNGVLVAFDNGLEVEYWSDKGTAVVSYYTTDKPFGMRVSKVCYSILANRIGMAVDYYTGKTDTYPVSSSSFSPNKPMPMDIQTIYEFLYEALTLLRQTDF
jgi:hypothetical protein